jgi:hypothetical protein
MPGPILAIQTLLPGLWESQERILWRSFVYDSHMVDDDSGGHSSGYGDGVVDCGETIELSVDLYNWSGSATSSVSATISTRNFYAVWPQNASSSYPGIPGGGTGTNSNASHRAVDPTTPDGHIIHFDLSITASHSSPWSTGFDVPESCITNNSHHTYVPLVVRNR